MIRKNSSFYNCMLAMLLAGTLSFSACGDDNDGPDDPNAPVNPEQPSVDQALSPSKQKERMDDIAQKFMQMTPASDFKSYSDLANYISDTYSDYDWDEVDDWATKCWESARGNTVGKTEEKDKYGDSYVYTDYNALLLASNFTGHFTANKGKWVMESGKYNDLQFTFSDKNGKKCVLKLETSGRVKKVYAANIKEWDRYDYDNTSYKYTEYYDRIKCTVGVPENIVLTLTQNGTELAKTTVKIDLASLSGENFDISKNSFTASTLVEMSNGYKFNASQVAYSGNQKCSVVYSMSKAGTMLASVSVASDLSGIPSCNVEAFSGDDFNINTDNINGKNALVKIDIMGKLQLQGTLKDVRKFAEYIEKAGDNEYDENRFKQWMNSANELANINLFYDNSSVKQASVKLDAFSETEWGGNKYWEMEPVLVFFDGSSNSMFDVFFNDTDFKNTINAFEALIEKYEDLIN